VNFCHDHTELVRRENHAVEITGHHTQCGDKGNASMADAQIAENLW
jgi:hypothetical protein